PEGLLDGMQRTVRSRKRLYGHDRAAVGLDREHQARAHALTVDEHRARAAHPVLAANVRPGQPEVLPQKVDEQAPRLDEPLLLETVDCHANRSLVSGGQYLWHLRLLLDWRQARSLGGP